MNEKRRPQHQTDRAALQQYNDLINSGEQRPETLERQLDQANKKK